MRILPVHIQIVGIFHHLLGDIGVIIQAGHNRHFRSDPHPDPAQQLPFRIVKMFRHHRAMQIKVDTRNPVRLPQRIEHHCRNPLIGFPRHHAAGHGKGPAQRHNLELLRRQAVNGAGNRQVKAAGFFEHVIPDAEAGPVLGDFERQKIGFPAREGVCFMLKTRDGNLFHIRISSTAWQATFAMS